MKTSAPGFFSICLVAAAVSAPALAQQRPASAGPADPQLLEDLIVANRILAMQGVVDAMGHVSVRHNRDPNRYLLSRARAPELVSEADIMEDDLDSIPNATSTARSTSCGPMSSRSCTRIRRAWSRSPSAACRCAPSPIPAASS